MNGFDFTAAMERVCRHMVASLPELSHIKMDYVATAFVQARKRVLHGMQASLTPMRFEGGRVEQRIDGRLHTTQRLVMNGREMLYVISFYLPRFLDLSFDEKIATTLHELWHIGPRFDGDLRRHEGRYYMHSASEREFDRGIEQLAQRWLSSRPSPSICGFLRYRFDALQGEHGCVVGRRVAHPRIVPLATIGENRLESY